MQKGPGTMRPGRARPSVVAVAPVMVPAVMVAPVPVMVVVAPVTVVAPVMAPAAVVVMAVAPSAVMAAAPAVMVAPLRLHHLGGGRRRGAWREGRRLGAACREETARHQSGRRQKPCAGRHRVSHRQHPRLRIVSPHDACGHGDESGAGGLNAV
ncbi:hypothetical protein SAMN02799631_02431 [Methylobacterium sp. 174MFSha1.1]|nr:hypothetical protein SAMN02799631_02431 [Methylobacterium sp. 174MFSha1.1]